MKKVMIGNLKIPKLIFSIYINYIYSVDFMKRETITAVPYIIQLIFKISLHIPKSYVQYLIEKFSVQTNNKIQDIIIAFNDLIYSSILKFCKLITVRGSNIARIS